MPQPFTLALAGNPNSGKTTLFNTLTGSRQQVGNYPGITVEKREGVLKHGEHSLHIVDLPGTYSLTTYSQEELVARNFLVQDKPQAVVDVLDASNLERNLYLTVQFMELGIPVLVVLNMMDEVAKRGMTIDTRKLSELLGNPVVETIARSGQGKEHLLDEAVRLAGERRNQPWQPLSISYGPDLDPVLDKMAALIQDKGFLTGTYPARWVALKYLEEDEEIRRLGRLEDESVAAELDALFASVSSHCQKTLDTHPEALIADYRYGFITSLLKQGVVKRKDALNRISFSDKADRILTHKLLGPGIMLAVLYGMFQITFGLGEAPLGWVESFFGWLGTSVQSLLPPGLLQSLIVSGLIDGVGGVLSFVPLILIMFFVLSFLEDSGYMARMAYMLDRVMRIFGLHGCSVMPFIISGGIPGGCAVPGLMAARTLRSPKEKLATVLTAPFLSCGAKVPVFLLISGAFFPNQAAQVLFWTTLAGWAVALIVARILRSTIITGEPTPFVMELPPYRMPTLKGLFIHTWERGWQYIKKAGTVILAISILIWAAMTFPGLPAEKAEQYTSRIQALEQKIQEAAPSRQAELTKKLQAVRTQKNAEQLQATAAGRIGTWLEPVSSWAGFDWKTNIALVGGIAAKEVIVSSLGTAYSLGEQGAGAENISLSDRLTKDPGWNKIKGISLMVFVLLYAPCFVTLVTMARETSKKWAVFSLVFNTAVAFALSVGVYQVGTAVWG
ncbi:ferrous iron transport protein B [Desulfovermiculus halophilus]|uniref:ferrous iron transport protein B n=1 Tax=Desulfovermiculus halophilus TaxID=339722 RepID=UPI0004823792|nr:ferrous iron transport protein B [Desulfovermiculus halophilus]